MGSFDNIEIGFKCPFCGEEVELQTKDGPCVFESFEVGDEFLAYDENDKCKGPETRIIYAYGDCPHRRSRFEEQCETFLGKECTCLSTDFYIWYEVFIYVNEGIITDIHRSIHTFKSNEYHCLVSGSLTSEDVDKFNAMKIAKEIEVWGRVLEPERLAKS